jgi:hypothetical protein
MIVVVFLVALVMILGGGAATFFGSDILLADRGLPMVIAGATIASAGAVLLGLGFVVRSLMRVEHQLSQVRDGIGDLRAANLLATARPPRPASALDHVQPDVEREALAEQPHEPGEDDRTEEGAALIVPAVPEIDDTRAVTPTPSSEPPAIVGRYESGGNAYTMYADGSIIADTPSGQIRFNSLDELKTFVSSGGESR